MKKTLSIAALLALSLAVCQAQGNKKPADNKAALKEPAKLKEKAPEKFKAEFDTTKGVFVVEVTRALSPNGADRFYNLVKHGYFDGNKFFRVVPGFVVQFGIHGDPTIAAAWRDAKI